VLGGVLSVTLAMTRAISIAEENLMLRIPGATTLVFDASYSSDAVWKQPSIDQVNEIGRLPYVRVYDFTFRSHFYSDDLQWPFVDNPGSLGPRGRPFMSRGVNNPEIADISTGLIYLVSGRTFTQEEIDNSAKVAIIPRDIAASSGVAIGSFIEIENVVYNFFATGEHDMILGYQIFEVEVIGLIGHIGYFDTELIYMPIGIVEEMLEFDTFTKLEFDAERFRNVGQGLLQEEPLIESLFVMHSPRMLSDFVNSASDILPPGWAIAGMDESIFTPVITSMDIVLQLVNGFQIGAILASIVIISLLIVLFLRDRKKEIGIYLAIGEKKSKILLQILMEVGIIYIVGIFFALMLGLTASNVVSNRLFEQHLFEQTELDHFQHAEVPWELLLYLPGELSVEEALELFNVTFSWETVILFVGLSLFIVFLATLIPIRYVVKLKAQELLQL